MNTISNFIAAIWLPVLLTGIGLGALGDGMAGAIVGGLIAFSLLSGASLAVNGGGIIALLVTMVFYFIAWIVIVFSMYMYTVYAYCDGVAPENEDNWLCWRVLKDGGHVGEVLSNILGPTFDHITNFIGIGLIIIVVLALIGISNNRK